MTARVNEPVSCVTTSSDFQHFYTPGGVGTFVHPDLADQVVTITPQSPLAQFLIILDITADG